MDQMKVASTTDATPPVDHCNDQYEALRMIVAGRLDELTGPLFTTTANGLADRWIDQIPKASRQYYTCKACFGFIERYGALATYDEATGLVPLFSLAGIPPFFQAAFAVVASRVLGSKITGVFYASKATWGLPKSGNWTHISVPDVPARYRYFVLTKTAHEASAEKLEDFRMLVGYRTEKGKPDVAGALADYPAQAAAQALRVLKSDTLYGGEKVLGVGEWFDKLHRAITGKSGPDRANIIWHFVATAPAGYCHIKTTMISTLLDDIIAGLPFDVIAAKFSKKMDGLAYHRPTAAPSDGQIEQAERLIANLGAAGSLRRRFARMADILEFIWKPKAAPVEPTAGGVFGHLKGKAEAVKLVSLPKVTITWEKFSRTVLPAAHSLEFHITGGPDSYSALVTAADPAAPNLIQWPNTVSWYLYHQGSLPQHWNLPESGWHKVTGVTEQPSAWGDTAGRFKHQGESVFVLLEGARDLQVERGQRGAGLFLSLLRAEFHGIGKTLEAHLHQQLIEGAREAEACGIRFQRLPAGKSSGGLGLRVNGTDVYIIDRWD